MVNFYLNCSTISSVSFVWGEGSYQCEVPPEDDDETARVSKIGYDVLCSTSQGGLCKAKVDLAYAN